MDALEWAIEGEKNGAGEILLTSMNADGTKLGYDINLTGKISTELNIPVVASGGAGKPIDMVNVLKKEELLQFWQHQYFIWYLFY